MMASQPIYAAYGHPSRSAAQARTGYTGQLAEGGTGWHLLGQRPYSVLHRRFLAPDSVSPFDAGGINRYAYCGGDPINRTDPDGSTFLDMLPHVGVFATQPASPSLMMAVLNATLQTASPLDRVKNSRRAFRALMRGEPAPPIVHLGKADVPGQPLTFRSVDEQHQVQVFKGVEAVESQIPDRIIRDASGNAVRIRPSWRVVEFGNTRAHVTDAVVDADEVAERVRQIRDDHRDIARNVPIHLITGTHGKFNANNYNKKGMRVGSARRFFNEDARRLGQYNDVILHDVGQTHFSRMTEIFGDTRQEKDIVLGFCFSAVDGYLLSLLNASDTAVYHLGVSAGRPGPVRRI
ncbi:RHS repeat-associated core domain-containing protein [Luteibacter sp. CQ10]|uniref:RHS repeat-associated core domain-containing protein n=1 Tax=Luteibacter sp. CQ10 TaxID=2805821 RepID=UPI0034A0E486